MFAPNIVIDITLVSSIANCAEFFGLIAIDPYRTTLLKTDNTPLLFCNHVSFWLLDHLPRENGAGNGTGHLFVCPRFPAVPLGAGELLRSMIVTLPGVLLIVSFHAHFKTSCLSLINFR